MKIHLGFLKDLPVLRRLQEEINTREPRAYYEVPIPAAAQDHQMVSFFDKETMMPRQVGWAVGSSGVLRCSLPPSQRVELRITWIEDGHLGGVRYVLGPASKFRTRVGLPGGRAAQSYDLL